MKIIIAGSRDFTDYNFLKDKMNHLTQNIEDITVVCGKARGTDSLGEQWAIEYGYNVIEMPADWNTYGKSAGYKRNTEMANIADGLVVFWDGESKGTKNMIEIATKKGLKVKRVFV